MAKRKEVVEPVMIPVGKCGEFEVTYRRVAGDEGPAAEFYGLVDGKRVKLLRLDDFECDPHYHHHPDTPQDRKYSLDPVVFGNSQGLYLDLGDIMLCLPEIVKAAGHAELAMRIRRQKRFLIIIGQVIDAMGMLRKQEKRKTKKQNPRAAKR